MSDDHNEPKDVYWLPPQQVDLRDPQWPADGWILDIGGGGEGIIGQIGQSRVIAIDTSERELAEAPSGPLKITMDARELHFLPETFALATAFYSLLYIPDHESLQQIFSEVARVLKPGGAFWIWDTQPPSAQPDSSPIFAVRLTVALAEQTVETGYGARWPDRQRGLDDYVALAKDAGFSIVEQSQTDSALALCLSKTPRTSS